MQLNGISGQIPFPERDKQPRSAGDRILKACGNTVCKSAPERNGKGYIRESVNWLVVGFSFDV